MNIYIYIYKLAISKLSTIPSLKEKKWKEFFIGGTNGIFHISSTLSGIDKNKLNMEKGSIPYVTRTDINNGINLFITDEQSQNYCQDEGNVISIGLDTQTVFYQANSFYTGQNIQILRNEHLNREVSMFIIPLLKIQIEKFNWGGNGATLGRLNRSKIMLPVTNEGKPDFEYMKEYMQIKEIEKQYEVLKYYYHL